MQKTSKLLIGLQITILMTAVALPAQAAINIGAPQTFSGSVVSLRSYAPGTGTPQVAPVPATTTTTTTTTTSSSTTPTTTDYPPGAPELFFDALATEEELNLTYNEFVEKRVNDFYRDNPTIFKDKTDKEKEDIILDLVAEGELFADIAIEIAIREGLDIE